MVERFYCGEAPRQLTIREGPDMQPLDARFDLRKHSSNGFGSGEGSAGSAQQLALALLADALRNDARAVSVHQDFSRRVIPLFPKRWTISRSRIRLRRQHRSRAQYDAAERYASFLWAAAASLPLQMMRVAAERGLRSVLLNYLHNICNDVGAAIEGSPKSFLQARTLLSGDGIPSRGHF
jgi:Family of unknown function (DUF6166)